MRCVSPRAASAAATMALWLLAVVVEPLFAPAEAHAIVLESVPAPGAVLARSPERVILRFNSKIEKRLTRVTLGAGRATPRPLSFTNESSQEPDRLVIPLAPLSPGPYVIRYKVLSADGHVTEGALRFTVGRPDQ